MFNMCSGDGGKGYQTKLDLNAFKDTHKKTLKNHYSNIETLQQTITIFVK